MKTRKIRMSGWNASLELANKLDEYVEKTGQTYASVYEKALTEFLKKHRDKKWRK